MTEDRERIMEEKRIYVRGLMDDVLLRNGLDGTHGRMTKVLDLDQALRARRSAGQPVPLWMRIEASARMAATLLEMIGMLLALPVIILVRGRR